MTHDDEICDYCKADESDQWYLRPIGFSQLTEDGPRLPLVKTWCGECEPGDEMDPEAHVAMLAAIQKQRRSA